MDQPSAPESGPLDPPMVSVGYKPEALSTVEMWRNFLHRLYPNSRRPVVRVATSIVIFSAWLGFVGYWLGSMGSPGLDPGLTAAGFGGVGLLLGLRLVAMQRAFSAGYRANGAIVFELDRDGITVRNQDRLVRIAWAGVRELQWNGREIVLRFRSGDSTWIPRRAFLDPAHEGRFLDVARSGMAEAMHPNLSDSARSER